MNNLVKDLNQYLSRDFRIQLYSDNGNGLQGFLEAVRPRLAVICLVGMYENHSEIFRVFENQFPDIPTFRLFSSPASTTGSISIRSCHCIRQGTC